MEDLVTGFVYIWFDRKHKRFYIGSHWGSPDDGYICSSRWMRNAYKRRPKDFKRRILCWNSNRKNLLEDEHRWLSIIPQDQIGIRYYNLNQGYIGHWTADEMLRKTVGQKIATSFKTSEKRKEFAKRQSIHMKTQTPPTNKGGRWFNNGNEQCVSPVCPEGWSTGRLPKGPWWNDHVNEKRSLESPGLNWHRGRLLKTGQKISLNKKGKSRKPWSSEERISRMKRYLK